MVWWPTTMWLDFLMVPYNTGGLVRPHHVIDLGQQHFKHKCPNCWTHRCCSSKWCRCCVCLSLPLLLTILRLIRRCWPPKSGFLSRFLPRYCRFLAHTCASYWCTAEQTDTLIWDTALHWQSGGEQIIISTWWNKITHTCGLILKTNISLVVSPQNTQLDNDVHRSRKLNWSFICSSLAYHSSANVSYNDMKLLETGDLSNIKLHWDFIISSL